MAPDSSNEWLRYADVSALPLIVAHRGASRDAPENTIPAFDLAWKQGADAVEGDFHLTGDGKIVCIHDETTKAVAGTELVVSRAAAAELKQLDVGAWFGKEWQGTTLPTLPEVLQTVPAGKALFIEVKCGPEILRKLYDDLQECGLSKGQIVIISFNAAVIGEVKRRDAGMKALLLTAFKNERRSGTLEVDDLLGLLHSTRADGLSAKARRAGDDAVVKRIIENGFEYHVWTVDTVKTAQRYAALGAASITTNVPGALRRKLQR